MHRILLSCSSGENDRTGVIPGVSDALDQSSVAQLDRCYLVRWGPPLQLVPGCMAHVGCVQIYKEPFCKRHYISVLSFTFLFRLFGYVACVFLAAVVSHAAGETWTKHKVSTGRPDVHFQYKAIVQFAVRSEGDRN